MIKLERTSVMNFENAIRGMRNPMNSWDKSDSYTTHIENPSTWNIAPFYFFLGENDLTLARKLIKNGGDHRKFLRQIFVSVDITAPLYWWKEYDTYKVGTVANSTSTMHKIHAKPFSREDFSCERMSSAALICLDGVIAVLEERRQAFCETRDRAAWDDMIQLLPSSFQQMRTCTLNYENLLNIYPARNAHKLPEWHILCDWIIHLPYFVDMCLYDNQAVTERLWGNGTL